MDPEESQKEGQEHQGKVKELAPPLPPLPALSPLPLLPVLRSPGPPGFPPGCSLRIQLPSHIETITELGHDAIRE